METKTKINPPHSRRARSIESITALGMGESNIYERNIAALIKQIHEAEKKSEENKKEKKTDKQTQTVKIKLTPINNQTIQYILSLKLRTPNMLTILREFLSNMKFLSVSTDAENRKKLLYSLSFCLKMEKKPQGTIIFRYGNKGTRFYIVLGGEVSVLILRETTVEMTFLNYVRYLFLLKVLKEDELAKKIISANPKSTFRITEKDIDIYYDNIISFINKYYTIVNLNESDIIENTKNESNNIKNQENDDLEDPKGLYDFNNNLTFESIKNKKIAKKYTLEGESKLKSSLQKLKAKKSLLLNLDDKKENQNSFSDKSSENSKNKESSEKNPDNIKLVKFVNIKKSDEDSKEKDISKEEKPMGIKYKATKRIPNYLELDICTFGPNDISKLVNFVIKALEIFYSKTNKVSIVEEYIRNTAVHPSLKYCDKYSKKEKLTVFQYFEITKKKEGDIFGELALQHNDNKRTGTMIATKDLVLGYLSKTDYNNCLRGVEMKKRKIEVNFIMSFSLFDEMNWVNFEKTYFNFLKKENLTSGQIIINQNEKVENIYFIMEGQIEITTNLTFIEISSILKQKNKKIKNKNKKNKEDEDQSKEKMNTIEDNYNKYDNNNNTNTIHYNSNYYYNRKYMMNNNKNDNQESKNKNKKDKIIDRKKYTFLTNKQIKELEDLKCFRLCVIDNKDILGLDDICINDDVSFVKATCTSSKAVVFSLKKSILYELKRKNSEIEKNLKNITLQRETIMIERLKLTSKHMFSIVKKNKINMTEVHKDVENLNIKSKDNRVRSAIYSKYIPKINIEFTNTININYKSNSNIKNLFKKNYNNKKLENNESISNKNNKFHNLKKNLPDIINNYNNKTKDSNKNNNSYKTSRHLNLLVDSEWDRGEKNNSPSLMERKSCLQKFMESVTDRVSQIRHSIRESKYTNLFAPLGNKKNKKDKNNKNNKKKKINIKFNSNNVKDSNLISENFEDQILNKNNENNNNKVSIYNPRNSISLIKTNNNNFVLVNKSKNRAEDKESNDYKLGEYEIKDDSLKQLLKSQKHIVKHQYTLSSKNMNNRLIKNKKISIITPGIRDPTKLSAFSELSKKYHLENKLHIMRHQTTAQFNPLNYMKTILGTRYKEHETPSGQKKFSKMLIENRHLINKVNTINCYSSNDFKNNNCINTFFKFDNFITVKPSQVDLLLYNKTIEKNCSVKFRKFSHEQENRRRIFSRNVKRRTKTTCFTRTLTKSVGVKK